MLYFSFVFLIDFNITYFLTKNNGYVKFNHCKIGIGDITSLGTSDDLVSLHGDKNMKGNSVLQTNCVCNVDYNEESEAVIKKIEKSRIHFFVNEKLHSDLAFT